MQFSPHSLQPLRQKGLVRQGHFLRARRPELMVTKSVTRMSFSLAKEAIFSYNSPDGEARPFLVGSAS